LNSVRPVVCGDDEINPLIRETGARDELSPIVNQRRTIAQHAGEISQGSSHMPGAANHQSRFALNAFEKQLRIDECGCVRRKLFYFDCKHFPVCAKELAGSLRGE
jgi:hypothetical protein